MEGFGGRYPGGPSRDPDGKKGEGRRTPDLPATEELERRAQEKGVRQRRRKRRKRILTGFLVVLLAAAGVGLWVGIQAHRTSEEMVQEREGQTPTTSPDQQERMLQELLRQPQSQAEPQIQFPGADADAGTEGGSP